VGVFSISQRSAIVWMRIAFGQLLFQLHKPVVDRRGQGLDLEQPVSQSFVFGNQSGFVVSDHFVVAKRKKGTPNYYRSRDPCNGVCQNGAQPAFP
jgi:hypothetical protein